MQNKLLLILAVLLVGACAPDSADPAPDCSEVPELCPEAPDRGIPAPDHTAIGQKHGTYGAATVHTKSSVVVGGVPAANCQPWSYLACLPTGQYYSVRVGLDCPSGRTCTLRSLNWAYRWDGLDNWTQYPLNSAYVCLTNVVCTDVTNKHSGYTADRRYGSLSDFQGWQWSGRIYAEIVLYGTGATRYNPGANIATFTYTDGI